ncbi:hypothetical protein RZS08_48940, partial [Arthrospira platensis SPKY1]|nr:hypothetical protein [Arthrospira platensis SPKY1]
MQDRFRVQVRREDLKRLWGQNCPRRKSRHFRNVDTNADRDPVAFTNSPGLTENSSQLAPPGNEVIGPLDPHADVRNHAFHRRCRSDSRRQGDP